MIKKMLILFIQIEYDVDKRYHKKYDIPEEFENKGIIR